MQQEHGLNSVYISVSKPSLGVTTIFSRLSAVLPLIAVNGGKLQQQLRRGTQQVGRENHDQNSGLDVKRFSGCVLRQQLPQLMHADYDGFHHKQQLLNIC